MNTPPHNQPDPPDQPPTLRLVRGHPTDEELAALLTILAAVTPPERTTPRRRSPWAASQHRLGHAPGPGAWRLSALAH